MMNSSVTDENYLHLRDIVDNAEKYQVKKIYLDLAYSKITDQEAIDKYRNVYFYAALKKIEISGPWSAMLNNKGYKESPFAYENFIQKWCDFLLRPVYFKRLETIDVLSMIKIEDAKVMLNKISEAVIHLENFLWPLKKKILVNISEYQEELTAASNQPNLPNWVRATTNGDSTFYHRGTSLTPALIHELTHLFIAQRELKLPAWFVEGLCEWTQDHDLDLELLKKSIKDKNLFMSLEKLEKENLLLIDLDQNLPFKNPYYLQAKAFVGYLQTKFGKNRFDQLLLSCENVPLEESLRNNEIDFKKEVHDFCEAYS